MSEAYEARVDARNEYNAEIQREAISSGDFDEYVADAIESGDFDTEVLERAREIHEAERRAKIMSKNLGM